MVDDEAGVRWSLTMLLGAHAFDIAAYPNGREALAWLRSRVTHCDLVVLDAMLADTSGFELADSIRRSDCCAPLVMISGYFYADDPAVQDALRSGLLAAFLIKPFAHDELMRTVRTVFSSGAIAPPVAPPPRR